MAIIKCPECNHDISDKAPVCPSCGVPIAGHIVKCPVCGKVYFSNLSECPQCHNKTGMIETTDASQNSVDVSDTNVPLDGSENKEEPSAKSINVHKNNRIVIMVVVVVALLVCGICYAFYHNSQSDKEQQAYEMAMSSQDADVLQNYLAMYPNAPQEHVDSIQSHLGMLKVVDRDWTNAVVSGSKSAIERYIAEHPNSPFKNVAQHMIDSIDWSVANTAGSVEALETYIESHPDGDYIEDANEAIKNLNSTTVQPEDKLLVSSVFNGFFQSLNARDEEALMSSTSPLMTQFLGKSNATRSDVVTFMHKIYKSGVSSMKWQSMDDYSIAKKDVGSQKIEYTVAFSAKQTVTHEDGTVEDSQYRVNAKVSPEGLISEFNMVKILE